MTDTGATKLTSLCIALAAVGALLGLAFNSGAPTGAGSSMATSSASGSWPATSSGATSSGAIGVAPMAVRVAGVAG